MNADGHSRVGTEGAEGVAFHEAGHAVACVWFEASLRVVTIAPKGEALGCVEHSFVEALAGYEDNRGRLEANALISLAGPACEVRSLGQGRAVVWSDEGYLHDVQAAHECLYGLCAHEDEARAYFQWMAERAKSLVALPRFVSASNALAEALITHRTLTGEEAREVIRRAWG